MKFRKKQVVIEAIKFTLPISVIALEEFCGNKALATLGIDGGACIMISTLEGEMRANPGDWIIMGVNGEFYPCKPDIFEKTYEKVEEE